MIVAKSRRKLVFCILLGALSILDLSGENAMAQLAIRLGGASVYDSTGKRVGQSFAIWCNHTGAWTPDGSNPNQWSTVLYNIDGKSYLLCVGVNEIPPHNTLWFESNDCSGTPLAWIGYFEDTLFLSAFVNIPGRTIYVKDPNAEPMLVTVNSLRSPDGSCSLATFTTDQYVPLIPKLNLLSAYTPPFYIR